MASVTYKDKSSLDKLDGVRWHEQPRDGVTVKEADSLGGLWREVREGDKIETVDDGFKVVRGKK